MLTVESWNMNQIGVATPGDILQSQLRPRLDNRAMSCAAHRVRRRRPQVSDDGAASAAPQPDASRSYTLRL